MGKLTKTEALILQLIAYEYTSKKIAKLLDVSSQTIYTHRGNLLTKLDVKNSAGMVRKAIEKSLLYPHDQVIRHPRIKYKSALGIG